MDINFNTKEELYRRLKPALNAKKEELNRNNYEYVTIDDIWNFLVEKKWKNANNLSLYQVTCDIFDVDNAILDNYIREKMTNKNRTIYFDQQEEV